MFRVLQMSWYGKVSALDVNKDVLNFNPQIPKREFWDYAPGWFIHLLRLWTGKPGPTTREKWYVALHFVREALDGARHDRDIAEAALAVVSERAFRTDSTPPKKVLN